MSRQLCCLDAVLARLGCSSPASHENGKNGEKGRESARKARVKRALFVAFANFCQKRAPHGRTFSCTETERFSARKARASRAFLQLRPRLSSHVGCRATFCSSSAGAESAAFHVTFLLIWALFSRLQERWLLASGLWTRCRIL